MNESNAIRVTDYLAEGNIVCNIGSAASADVVKHLVNLLSLHVGGFQQEEAVAAVLEREELASTVLIDGLALPHARLDNLAQPLVAVGISPKGISFPDEAKPVHAVILVLSPKSDPSMYLKLVSAISKSLKDKELRKKLYQADKSTDAYRLLTNDVSRLPTHLVARDLMDASPVTLREEDDLATAINVLCAQRLMDVPVIDDVRDLRGVVSLEDLLKLSMPEHFLWMEDLTPIVDFQPFTELLRKDKETKVADFMREQFVSMRPDTPAIQLAKDFMRNNTRQILLTEGTTLTGVVTIQSFIAQLFWA
ncbi:MAG: CBS domain-containing protein [Spartobacteria bacterium]|nr:CBS domain-containing protein [Spartobacteria bacterium]